MATKPRKTRKLLHHLLLLDHHHHAPEVEPIPVFLPGLPETFYGARIAVAADLHLPDLLVSPGRLVSCISAQHPDAIFLPGDLTNSYTDFDEGGLRQILSSLAAVAPCYVIPGNHEWRLDRQKRFRAVVQACGCRYLCDSFADWEKNGQSIRVYGMGQRRPMPLPLHGQPAIVLAHRPDHLPYYEEARWDLVVCGHAHGGQVRVGSHALYAPDQGFFPAYSGGVYTAGQTTMVVSRGLGNSSVPLRMGNDPHLPLILLFPKEKKDPRSV